jgi:hypothetical protein
MVLAGGRLVVLLVNCLQAAIAAGYRMKRCDYCPEEVYDRLLMKCWQYNDDDRPNFLECYNILCDILTLEVGDQLRVIFGHVCCHSWSRLSVGHVCCHSWPR